MRAYNRLLKGGDGYLIATALCFAQPATTSASNGTHASHAMTWRRASRTPSPPSLERVRSLLHFVTSVTRQDDVDSGVLHTTASVTARAKTSGENCDKVLIGFCRARTLQLSAATNHFLDGRIPTSYHSHEWMWCKEYPLLPPPPDTAGDMFLLADATIVVAGAEETQHLKAYPSLTIVIVSDITILCSMPS